MNCNHIQDLLPIYWDLPEHDLRRMLVDEHVKECACCAEEFRLWEESTDMIRNMIDEPASDAEPDSTTAKSVMDRIYRDEVWRVPVTDRLYRISDKLRRTVTALIVCCITLFVFSFLYSVTHDRPVPKQVSIITDTSIFGLQSPQLASQSSLSLDDSRMSSAVASISEPFMYKIGPIHTYPDYLLALSLLGLTCTLLIMNWLSRTRL